MLLIFVDIYIFIAKHRPDKYGPLSRAPFLGYIWDNYPTWTGLYGESHDVLSATEKNDYTQFVRNTHDGKEGFERYTLLEGLEIENYPFSESNTDRQGSHYRQPNLQLTKLLATYQTTSISAAVAQNLSDEVKLPAGEVLKDMIHQTLFFKAFMNL